MGGNARAGALMAAFDMATHSADSELIHRAGRREVIKPTLKSLAHVSGHSLLHVCRVKFWRLKAS